MAAHQLNPSLRRTKQNTQLSYELPHRIYDSAVYPAQSVNGSTVLIYGHSNGVKIVWRGGRSFKPRTNTPNASKKTNGAEAGLISLDSDDDDAEPAKFEDKPEFEEEEDDEDATRPFPRVLQTLDLQLGASVLHLAVLPSAMTRQNQSLPKAYQESSEKIVLVAACSDSYSRLITLPLTPPSPESKNRPEFRKNAHHTVAGTGHWGEKVIKLSGHQRITDGVSVTLDSEDPQASIATGLSAIVASYSKDISGLLFLYKIPLHNSPEQIEPFQTVYLPSPAAHIAFNTSITRPRQAQLLVAGSDGCCRIYSYTMISRTSDTQTQTSTEQGSWLLSMHAGFRASTIASTMPHNFGRKRILDAKWVLGGRAVIALMDDGEWVIWDIEGSGPGSSQGLLGRDSLSGGSKTTFALSGIVESRSTIRNGSVQPSMSKFAPMTPGTRKQSEPFGPTRASPATSRGQISVLELAVSASSSIPEESIAIWYGESFLTIPSLIKYWQSHQTGNTNPFVGASGGRLIKIEAVELFGERCSGISQLPYQTSRGGSPSDILILGESRFVIINFNTTKKASFRETSRLSLPERAVNGGGLEDIDKALALMDRDTKMELF